MSEMSNWRAYWMSLLKAWRMAEFDTGSSLMDRWTFGFVFSNSHFLQTNNSHQVFISRAMKGFKVFMKAPSCLYGRHVQRFMYS